MLPIGQKMLIPTGIDSQGKRPNEIGTPNLSLALLQHPVKGFPSHKQAALS